MARTRDFLAQNAPWLGAGALLTGMSSFGQTFFISVFAGHIQSTFALSHGAWGSIYAIGTTASAVVMIWAGVLTDRYRARSLGMACLFGLAITCLFVAVNPYAVLLPLAVFGLRIMGQGMLHHIAIVAMARWFVATRGRALATASLGYSLAEMFLPVTFVFLMGYFHWRSLWVLAALICCLAALFLRFLLREERVPSSEDQNDTRTGMNGRHWTRLEALRHPLFWFMVPAIFGLSAFGTALLFHQVHYAEVMGFGHITFVGLLPIYSAVAVGMMIVSGIALDKYGTRRLIPFFMVPASLAFLLFAQAQSVWVLTAAFILFGMTAGSNGTLSNAFWAEVYGTAHIGSIKAMTAAVMVLGSALGPALTGALIDWGVAIDTQYFYISAYYLLVSLSVWLAVRQANRSISVCA